MGFEGEEGSSKGVTMDRYKESLNVIRSIIRSVEKSSSGTRAEARSNSGEGVVGEISDNIYLETVAILLGKKIGVSSVVGC